ncbi:MAG: hypothetical protein IKT09_05100 [Synergistes sp.]|nr:hypothetical protein [Synergistes sp.]
MEIKNIVVPQGHKDPITIIEGIAPNPLPLFNYQGCQYTALDVESFCSLVKAKGARLSAIIFADAAGFTAILDDTVISRKQDTVTMPYTYSVQAEEWEPVLSSGGTAFALKDLIDYIKRCDAATIDGFEELLVAFKNFKYVSNVTGDFTFDNRNNYTFCVKVRDAEGTVRIPQLFLSNIEIYKNSGFFQRMEIEVEIYQPKTAGEQPLIKLRCPKFPRYLQAAQAELYSHMKNDLDGWLVVQGCPYAK